MVQIRVALPLRAGLQARVLRATDDLIAQGRVILHPDAHLWRAEGGHRPFRGLARRDMEVIPV